MKERIAQLRKYLGLTQEAFGEKIYMTDAMVSMIETGKKPIQEKTIALICHKFDVNEQWLRNGTGDMLKSPVSGSDEDERKLLSMFKILTAETKKLVLKMVETFANSSGVEPKGKESPPIYRSNDKKTRKRA